MAELCYLLLIRLLQQAPTDWGWRSATAVQERVVDLAFFNLLQIVQRGRRIPALLDGQFAPRAWCITPIAEAKYASNDYTELLTAHRIDISMSRKGNPWDNTACESFMETLKYEEVLRNEYRNLAEARVSIRQFLEKVYNQKPLHSALGYRPPAEFEAQLAARNKEAAARQLAM